MSLQKKFGFTLVIFGILGTINELGFSYLFPPEEMTIYLGVGTNLHQNIKHYLKNSPYKIFIQGNGKSLLDCDSYNHTSLVNYLYANFNFQLNSSSESIIGLCKDQDNLESNLEKLSKNFIKQHPNKNATFEVYSLPFNSKDLARTLAIGTKIIQHNPLNIAEPNSLSDQVIINSLIHHNSNDYQRFIISLLISPNKNSFGIIVPEASGSIKEFSTILTTCNKTSILGEQNLQTQQFINFIKELHQGKDEQYILKEFLYEQAFQYPQWYVELQEKYITRLIELMLFNAAIASNSEQLECFINHNNFNPVLGNGNTPLIIASKFNNSDGVKFFLENGANATQANNNDITALMTAANYGYTKIIELLLPSSNVNQLDQNLNSALTYAAINGHYDAVIILLKHGADPSIMNIEDLKPIYYAVRNSHDEIVKILAEKLSALEEVSVLIQEASSVNDYEMVQLLSTYVMPATQEQECDIIGKCEV